MGGTQKTSRELSDERKLSYKRFKATTNFNEAHTSSSFDSIQVRSMSTNGKVEVTDNENIHKARENGFIIDEEGFFKVCKYVKS